MKLKQAVDIAKYLSIQKRIQKKAFKWVESFLRSCNIKKKIAMESFRDPVSLLNEQPVKWIASDDVEKFWILRGIFSFRQKIWWNS